MRDRTAQDRNACGTERRWRWGEFWPETQGAQLLEFAFAMPILVVLLIGIIDFGGAYNLKQKLNNAAREGARFGSATSCADCSQTCPSNCPKSTLSIRNVVENYLTNANVPLCGTAGTTTPTSGPGNNAWTITYTSSPCSSSAPFTMTIERNYNFLNGTTTIVATRVTLSYPYTWTFGRVIGLMVKGANPALPSTISSDAIVENEP
jgi:Flp pilus assembly protein TadG